MRNLGCPARRGGYFRYTITLSLAVASLSLPALASDGSTSIRLPDSARFPESVTPDANGTLFVSSIADGGFLKVAADRAVMSQFLKPGDRGTRSTFGLLADCKRGVLWVASNDATALGTKGPTGTEGAWVKAFDVTTGAIKTSVRLPGARALANDFALDGDGSLYVSNTFAPQILRLKPDATELDVFVENAVLSKGLDGIAFGTDGNLYINTFMGGELFRIDVRSRHGRQGHTARNTPSAEVPGRIASLQGRVPDGRGQRCPEPRHGL